jgi:polyisoprenoid-binding protein YceI
MRFTFFIIFLFATLNSNAQKYVPIDKGSKIHFIIKNFGIGTGGDFQGLKGEINFDTLQPASSFFNVSIAVKTIDTDNNMRDKDLRSKDYFDEQKFPEIKLTSTRIDKTNKTGNGYYYFTGNLIIKGIAKPVSFPFLAERTGDGFLFTGEFTINRLDFGVGETSMVLANRVIVSLKVFANKM